LRHTLDTALGARTAAATFSFEDGVLILDPAVRVDVAEFERLGATPATAKQRLGNFQQALAADLDVPPEPETTAL
jgi:hypothetical protein